MEKPIQSAADLAGDSAHYRDATRYAKQDENQVTGIAVAALPNFLIHHAYQIAPVAISPSPLLASIGLASNTLRLRCLSGFACIVNRAQQFIAEVKVGRIKTLRPEYFRRCRR